MANETEVTQQDIFQNMVKGNWKTGKWGASIVTDDSSNIPKGTGHDEIEYYGGYLIAESLCNKATGEAIISAVNSTYGKGINPESVEKMKIYCECQESYFIKSFFIYEGKRYEINENSTYAECKEATELLDRLRKEALTAAKLT